METQYCYKQRYKYFKFYRWVCPQETSFCRTFVSGKKVGYPG